MSFLESGRTDHKMQSSAHDNHRVVSIIAVAANSTTHSVSAASGDYLSLSCRSSRSMPHTYSKAAKR